MQISSQQLFFARPEVALLLLLLLPLLYGYYSLAKYRSERLMHYGERQLIPRLLIPRSRVFAFTKHLGWLCVWSLLCLAFMGPFGNVRSFSRSKDPLAEIAKRRIPQEVLFLVDTSASMAVPDASQKRSRLEESKALIDDIVSRLRGQFVSLYAFTSELTPVVPATLDYLFLRLSARDLHIDQGDVGGTDFGKVFQELEKQLLLEPYRKEYVVVLMSDGGDVHWEGAEGKEKERVAKEILEKALFPPSLSIHIFTLGIGAASPGKVPRVSFEGKPVYSKLQPALLQALAEQNGGTYYTVQDWSSWALTKDLYERMEALPSSGEGKQIDTLGDGGESFQVDLYYQIPLALALLFYCLNLLLPEVRRT